VVKRETGEAIVTSRTTGRRNAGGVPGGAAAGAGPARRGVPRTTPAARPARDDHDLQRSRGHDRGATRVLSHPFLPRKEQRSLGSPIRALVIGYTNQAINSAKTFTNPADGQGRAACSSTLPTAISSPVKEPAPTRECRSILIAAASSLSAPRTARFSIRSVASRTSQAQATARSPLSSSTSMPTAPSQPDRQTPRADERNHVISLL
jgi:hypothetical protein